VHQPGKGRTRLALSALSLKNRLFLFFVLVITYLVLTVFALHGPNTRRVEAAAPASPEPRSAVMPILAPPPGDDQIMSFAYFVQQGDMDSTLRLNNNLPYTTTATVTLL
jgi:hypothetical protein